VLTRDTPLYALFVLFALTIPISALARTSDDTDRDWHLGVVVPGSIRETADGYHFTLVRRVGSSNPGRTLEIWTQRSLPESVCDGVDVFVARDSESERMFSVTGFNDGKYDHCWEHRCDRAAYVACRGYDQFQ